jgi:hypothetical protein
MNANISNDINSLNDNINHARNGFGQSLKDNSDRVVNKYYLADVIEEEFPLRAYYMIDGEKRRYCGFKTVHELISTITESQNNQWNEVIRNKGEGYQKFFIDVDCKTTEVEKMPFTFDEYINNLINELKSMFMICKITAHIIHCESDRSKKYSRHIICQNVVIRGDQSKILGRFVHSCIKNIYKYEYNLSDEICDVIAKWMDLSVYDKHHSLRTHLSAKPTAPIMKIIGGLNDKFDETTLITVCNKNSIVFNLPDWINSSYGKPVQQYVYEPQNDESMNRIKMLLDNLNPSRYDSYDSWCKIGMALFNACKGSDAGAKIWSECSAKKNPEKYKLGECESKYSTFKLQESSITMGTIFAWAKIDCEVKLLEYKQTELKAVTKRKTSKFENYSSQIKNAKNIKNLVLDKPTADKETIERYIMIALALHRLLAVKSPMDTGKSTLILDFIRSQIEKNPKFTCVMLQFRTSLSDEISKKTKDMGFKDYRSVTGEIDLEFYSRVFIQIESLHRLIYNNIDLLIIDEVESVNAQLFAGLNVQNDSAIQDMYQNILKDSKQIIMLDGLLMDRTIKAYESYLGEKFFVHVNTPLVEKKKLQIMVSECQWKDAIIDDLCMNRKIYVVSPNGKSFIEKMAKYIETKCNEKDKKINILTIFGGKDNSDVTKNFTDELVKHDLVIASPSISAGVDFNVDGYFYKVYSFVSSRKVGAVSQLQSLKRVRKPICKDITMLVQHCNRIPLPLTPEDIIFAAENKMWHNSIEGIKWPVGTRFIRDKRGNTKFADVDNDWFKFFLQIQSIINIQKFDVLGCIINRMTEEGYDVEILEEISNIDHIKVAKDVGKFITSKNNKEIADAKDISSSLAVEYLGKKRRTACESAELSKYNLRLLYDWNGPINEEFVRKYRSEDVVRMYITMKNKNTPLDTMANEAEMRIINRTDIDKVRVTEHVDKHRAIRDLLEFMRGLENDKGEIIHNSKEGGALDKIREYINEAVKSRHSAYKDKKLQTNNDRVCQLVNGFISDYGAKIILDGKQEKSRETRIYKIVNVYEEHFTTDRNNKTLPFIDI